jgi:tripartite-type tricarboxylate transporter receptor subunit TctC
LSILPWLFSLRLIEIINKLSHEVGKILAMPDIREQLIASGREPYHSDPQKMGAQMKADYAENARIIKVANIRLEE